MRDRPGARPARLSARARSLLLCLCGSALLVLAAPRAEGCAVDDESDAVAEGILQSSEGGEATQSMSCKLLVPGPHLRVTPHREPSAAELRRANEIRARARAALGKYQDYRAALRDGFEIKFPNLPLKRYHFSNPANARDSREAFDPARPTSLLYEKTGDGYRLVGAMYTAPRVSDEAELDRRFPINVAPWHLHTNLCIRPAVLAGRHWRDHTPDRRFGPNGSIATANECAAAGGTFTPVLFGWMTHVDLYDSYEKG
jgi:hypothetical protein